MEVVIVAVIVGIIGALFGITVYLRRHPEKQGVAAPGSGLMSASLDEIFHPSAVDARADQDREQRLIVTAPTPDPQRDFPDGRIRL